MDEALRIDGRRAYYSASLAEFLTSQPEAILGELLSWSEFTVEKTQTGAWEVEISLLQNALGPYVGRGGVAFEFVIPRFGRRIDVVLLIDNILFVLEFKIGGERFDRSAVEQVWDYALDLKNFHETSRDLCIVPLLIATDARSDIAPILLAGSDQVLAPIEVAPQFLERTIESLLDASAGPLINWASWNTGRYRPTPTIIEAARALYGRHSVEELSRHDAGAKNLAKTGKAISQLIRHARDTNTKAICFVTGVPGAGKTLVGLDVATKHMDPSSELHSVYLSGNGPLVAILREALTRDKVRQELERGRKIRKGEARQMVEAFIQNVHRFRDECLTDSGPPNEHVAIFDEAQRAWDLQKTVDFMTRKKKRADFSKSESEFLISCLDRHTDWAVVICLVGGGQEIHTGEAGIGEWMAAIHRSFPEWYVYVSPQLHDEEYRAPDAYERLANRAKVIFNDDLHLSVSMRSFRAERLSGFVKSVLDLEVAAAAETYSRLAARYPIRLTRNLAVGKAWLKSRARGSERYGIVASSQAQRLKPHAIDVRSPTDPVHWFLDGKEDTRSSFYLEDAATEFDIQGLELDWTCVVWDADFRHGETGWHHHSFEGDRWKNINKPERKIYLKNAYRVLLTRARQGMVIVVPEGAPDDPTRAPEFYDPTFEYLESLGIAVI
jgi:hypothetical protein